MNVLRLRTVLCVLFAWLAVWALANDQSIATHIVKRGETLSSIAKAYYGSAQMLEPILTANHLTNPDQLREGQRLVIPTWSAPTQSADTNQPAAPVVTQTVQAEPSVVTNPAPTTALAVMDAEKIRRLAAAAIGLKYPALDLSQFDAGFVMCMEHPTDASKNRLVATWLGREALALEKGDNTELDRKKVRKLQVMMTVDGRVLDIVDTESWLNRSSAAPTVP